jgi:hypothetical protein
VSAVVVCAGSALALTSSPIDGLAEGSFATAALRQAANQDAAPGRMVANAAPASGQDRPTAARVGPAAIAASALPTFVFDRSAHDFHVRSALCTSRLADRHSLRAAPQSDQDSSDGDDDDDDDGDGDGDGDGLWTPGRIAPKASGHHRVTAAGAGPATIAANALPAFVFDRGAHEPHARPDLYVSRRIDRHSLRAPPVSDEDSSDADREDDDGDDDEDDFGRSERTGGAAPVNVNLLVAGAEQDRRPLCFLPTLHTHLPSSFVFDVQSLRAPPQ